MPLQARESSAKIQCLYSFSSYDNLITNPSCNLAQPAPAANITLPSTPALSSGPLTGFSASSWSTTPGWSFNPLFQCCSFSPDPSGTNTVDNPTLITVSDLSNYGPQIDRGQQSIELSLSYFTSNAPSSSSLVTSSDVLRILVRFLNAQHEYILDSSATVLTKDLIKDESDERLVYNAFDLATFDLARVPIGARAAVVQIIVPSTHTQYCFDYIALRLVSEANHPVLEEILQYALIGVGSLVFINAITIPILLFHGLPGWLYRTAPVNFFQKNPVVDHYVPLALFISTCQWIYNIIFLYLGSRSNIVHSTQAVWLIPLVLIGIFFVSAFAHWVLFLCYNQSMLQSQRRNQIRQPRTPTLTTPSSSGTTVWDIAEGEASASFRERIRQRRQRAPYFGLWAAWWILCLRGLAVAMAAIQESFWSLPIGLLLALPETVALISVIWYFAKTIWHQVRKQKLARSSSTASTDTNMSKKRLHRPTHDGSDLDDGHSEDEDEEEMSLSSSFHRAYVRSLLVGETSTDAGCAYGQPVSPSSSRPFAPFAMSSKPSAESVGASTAVSESGSTKSMGGSTLNTTISLAASSSSSASNYSRHTNQFDFNTGRTYDIGSPPNSRPQFLPLPSRQRGGMGGAAAAANRPRRPRPISAYGGRRESFISTTSTSNNNNNNNSNNNKLTWNSVTTSYTTASTATHATQATVTPLPTTWDYVRHPRRYALPLFRRTYLLIARLPLRILVAVLTTLVVSYDVLITLGATQSLMAIPASCMIGAKAYPGTTQFDNTMNVARAMHTVIVVLLVFLLPFALCVTLVHQVRMVQKYNWCLRLLRLGNYGFVPGGREYRQHLKHPVRFIGYTVGFGVVGLCFTLILLVTLCTLVAMLLVAATFRLTFVRALGSRAMIAVGICCGLILLLWLVQMLAINHRFRMRDGSRFHISRKASFHHWEFFWAFFNIVFGAVSFAKRILLSVLSMSVYSTRIDLVIMGGRFRPWDGGYSAFVGLVLADHVHNNPILLEFVQILRDLHRRRRRYPNVPRIAIASPTAALLLKNRNGGGGAGGAGIGGPRGGERYRRDPRLVGLEEEQEEKMEDLVARQQAAEAHGGGGAIPLVTRVHHYFRIDPRADRHLTGQGPASSEGESKVHSQLLLGDGPYRPSSSSSSSSEAAARGHNNNNNPPRLPPKVEAVGTNKHARLADQDPVSREQIQQHMSEARRRSVRIINRWFLCITLARNPQLIQYRRTRAEDFLHPIAHGPEYGGIQEEEEITDIHWDRED
ncbi:hypothetical protein BGZ73_001256 [Actinomortierella ambigua]|nr:hypothetical protein BGZ73_001256 [Actinomortierella ambigua]